MVAGMEGYGFGQFRLDPANAMLWRGDDRVALAPKPFDILCHLVQHAGELVTKDELLDAVWPAVTVGQSSLTFSINALRAALDDDAKSPRYIETVSRRGYRFIAPVSVSVSVSVSVAAPRATHLRSDEPHAAVSSARLPCRTRNVGRLAELEKLRTLLRRATTGERQVVFVTGEAGIGKTTLLRMLVEQSPGAAVGVLWGSCVEHFGTAEPFHPLIEALQQACGGVEGAQILAAMRDHAPAWLAQMSRYLDQREIAALRKEVFGATRERMLRELCELVEFLSEDHPWLLVLEDLHWSDYATLDALSLFARRPQTASTLLIATYRRSDVLIGDHPIRIVQQDLQVRGCCTEIALDRLSRGDVEQYLALRFASAEIGNILAPTVFERTAGHPLFVTSLVDYLVSQKAIDKVEDSWRLSTIDRASTGGIPDDLHQMITSQIDLLDTEDQALLEAACVAGTEFSAALAASALERDVVEVERACEKLSRNGQILRASGVDEWADGTFAGRYMFLHALYQEVLYGRLPPGQRAHLHRRFGERLEAGYLERTNEIASTLALHFEEGRDFLKAIGYLRQAAALATKRFTHREAAHHLTRALGLVDRIAENDRAQLRLRILQERAWTRRSAGELRGALDDFAAVVSCAREANQRLVEVEALLDLSRFCLFADRRRCLDIAEQAYARSRALDDDFVKTLANASRANMNLYLKGWRDDDGTLCRHATEILSRSQDPFIGMRRRRIENTIDLVTSNYQKAYSGSEHGKILARDNGDLFMYILFSVFGAISLLHLGRWGDLSRHLDEALKIAERNESRHLTCPFYLLTAWLHVEALDFEGAISRCTEALDPEVDENPFNFFLGRLVLCRAKLGLRDYAAASKELVAIEHRIEIVGIPIESYFAPIYYHSLCEYLLATGDLERAGVEASRMNAIAAGPAERTYLALSHRMSAMIAIAAGDRERARDHLARAIATSETAEVPLAAWRVYAAAAEFYESTEDDDTAAEFRSRSANVVHKLAETLDRGSRLRASLLSGCLRPQFTICAC
jgi:DNA-binding winged helix-turn-helix (wHTH) protein/type II secretory pathway predicted ATPase ExeA/tetratricopeptide (TPR) repeat protein